MRVFFCGPLRDDALRAIVLGQAVDGEATQLFGWQMVAAREGLRAVPAPGEGTLDGLLVTLTQDALDRLTFYEGVFCHHAQHVTVAAGDALLFAPAGAVVADTPWHLADWQSQWADTSRIAAREIMDRMGSTTGEPIATLLPFIENRAWSQARAAQGAPRTLRSPLSRADTEVRTKPGHDGFFRMVPFAVRYRRFKGDWSATLNRECAISYDVALVLPYDPVTDQVLLVEQLRFGPIHRGDPYPWVLEPVAGMVDLGETPEQAARRECLEEADLGLKTLIPLASGYASPGYSTEFYHGFIGLCDLSGRAAQGQAGLDHEHEDIRNHILPFDATLSLIASGEINAVPLQMLLWGLASRRDALRAAV